MKTVITFGEIMLRLSTPRLERISQVQSFDASFGGGEANVAVSLANFGIPVEYVTRLPANDLAEACLAQLRSYQVGTRFVQRGGERLGIYFLETGAAQRPSKVLYDRAGSSMATVNEGTFDWDKIFTDSIWFHWSGITPAISQTAAEVLQEALEVAQEHEVTVSVDLNYRKNLWRWGKKVEEVMPGLVKDCDVIIGNEEDAERVFGICAHGVDIKSGIMEPGAYQNVCEQLARQNPLAKQIAITLRGSLSASRNTWSAVLRDGEDFHIEQQYDIDHIVDRVGSGDAFAAGLIYGLLTFPEHENALRFAIAASCLKHSIWGDFNQVSVTEVENLLKDTSGRISR